MVKRIAIQFPDGSISIMSNTHGEAAALAQGRREVQIYNKGEKDGAKKAELGEIEIDLVHFRSRI